MSECSVLARGYFYFLTSKKFRPSFAKIDRIYFLDSFVKKSNSSRGFKNLLCSHFSKMVLKIGFPFFSRTLFTLINRCQYSPFSYFSIVHSVGHLMTPLGLHFQIPPRISVVIFFSYFPLDLRSGNCIIYTVTWQNFFKLSMMNNFFYVMVISTGSP